MYGVDRCEITGLSWRDCECPDCVETRKRARENVESSPWSEESDDPPMGREFPERNE